MEFRQLKQLLVLSETLNFHRAADRLGIAQPPLSFSIKKLEAELGVVLFERHRSGLKLTPAGEAVLGHARSTIAASKDFREAARESATGEGGVLRLGFTNGSAYSPLPKLLRPFKELYPGVELSLESLPTLISLRRLDDNSLDVALVLHPTSSMSKSRVIPLERYSFELAVKKGSSLSFQDEVSLSELEGEAFIICNRMEARQYYDGTLRVFEEARIKPKIAAEASHIQARLGLVEAGMGVAFVPAIAKKYAGPNIKFLKIRDLPMDYGVCYALAMPHGFQSAAAKNFIDLAHSTYRVDELRALGNPADSPAEIVPIREEGHLFEYSVRYGTRADSSREVMIPSRILKCCSDF
jgi:DNA-binding transcriptional LysR family regulator